jgi:hypothetical protein
MNCLDKAMPLSYNDCYGRTDMRSDIRAKVIYYNVKTGEILDEYEHAIFIGHKPKIDKGFIKVFVGFLRDIIEDEEVLKGPAKLLLYAVDLADYNSLEVHIVPRKAIRDLDIGERTFYRWLKTLLDKGYMEKIAINVYRLKPYSAIKGQMSKVPEPDF